MKKRQRRKEIRRLRKQLKRADRANNRKKHIHILEKIADKAIKILVDGDKGV